MRVDIHNHVIPRRFIEQVEQSPVTFMARVEGKDKSRRIVHEQGYVYPLFDEFFDPQAKLESMDRKGIDIAVLSPAPPMFYYWADVDLALRVAALVNDGVADIVNSSPQRLRGMATIPMQHPDAAIAEMERVARELGFKAVEIGTSIEGMQLAEQRFRPVLRRAQDLGLFVFAHPYYVGAKSGLESYYLTNLVGNPLDTAVMVANLMFSGALDDLPDLKICLAHGGGFLPYQLGRLVHGHKVRAETHQHSSSSPGDLIRRFWFDSLVFEPRALRYLIDLVGADRICLGTDSPFDMGDEQPGQTIESIPHLHPHERHEICCGTALKLLAEGSHGL